MARRSNKPETTEATETETPAEATEAETTETPAEATEEKVEEVPIDLEPFKAAAEAAFGEADSSTGDLPVTAFESVNKVYREIEGQKGKIAARNWLDEEMKSALKGKDIARARAFVDIKDNLTAAGGSTSTRTPADPTTAFVNKVAALNLATAELEANVPEGVNENWQDKVNEVIEASSDDLDAYRTYVNSDDSDAEAPEVSPVVRQVFKLIAGRGTSSPSTRVAGGPRRSVETHLTQVFADLEPGSFLSINEIAKAASAEYGDDRPSAGAVSARLFRKGGEPYKSETVQASAEEGKPRGAVRI